MDPGCNGVLAVKDEIAAVAVADFRLVGDAFVKIKGDLRDLVGLLPALVSVAGDLQLIAVDHHFLIGFYVSWYCVLFHHVFHHLFILLDVIQVFYASGCQCPDLRPAFFQRCVRLIYG